MDLKIQSWVTQSQSHNQKNHTLYNQIKLSLDTFLKKSDRNAVMQW